MRESSIYLGYDRSALDAQYNNRARFPDFQAHFDRWAGWSSETRRRLPAWLDVPFGPGALETLDIFPAERRDAPIYLMIHGGYWYSLDKSHYSFVAEGLRPHGITTIVNNYGLAPNFSMDAIVRHNVAALSWLLRNAEEYGADPTRIYVCGHSAGAHLAAMLLSVDWSTYKHQLATAPIRGTCLIGGIFNLEPIRLSFLNEKLNLSADEARRNSPIHRSYAADTPTTFVVAADESPEFHRQSREMHEMWSKRGFTSHFIVPPGLNHYDVADQLKRPDSDLVSMPIRCLAS